MRPRHEHAFLHWTGGSFMGPKPTSGASMRGAVTAYPWDACINEGTRATVADTLGRAIRKGVAGSAIHGKRQLLSLARKRSTGLCTRTPIGARESASEWPPTGASRC